MDAPIRRDVTAYHEAGHAVVGVCLGFSLSTLNVIQDRGQEGICCYNDAGSRVRHICFTWGGGIAERRRAQGTPHCSDDRRDRKRTARKACTTCGPAEKYYPALAAALVRRCRNLASRIVEENWATVERVAGMLLREDKVAGQVATQTIKHLVPCKRRQAYEEEARSIHRRNQKKVTELWDRDARSANKRER